MRVGMKEAIGTPQASGSISLPPGPLCKPPNLNYICTLNSMIFSHSTFVFYDIVFIC